MRHPREMGSAEVNAFLSHLAVEGQVSASTQNQALSALLFLYREQLERDLDLEGVVRARKPRRLPVVLTEEEVRSVLQRLEGSETLVAGLLYGSGLRLMEALRPAPIRKEVRSGCCTEHPMNTTPSRWSGASAS